MKKLFILFRKDFSLCLKDRVGLLLLFVMPMFLTLVMIALQDASFEQVEEQKIPIAFVNDDQDLLGNAMQDSIAASDFFAPVSSIDNKPLTAAMAQRLVAEGRYQMGIVIPDHTTQTIKNKLLNIVKGQLPPDIFQVPDEIADANDRVLIFYDPTTKFSFKQATTSSLRSYINKAETAILFKTYANVLSAMTNQEVSDQNMNGDLIGLEESYASTITNGVVEKEIFPNSTQHNIPAWILFAMFFICIPMAGNIIEERDSGIYKRLKTMPLAAWQIVLSKVLIHVLFCIAIAIVLFVFGLYVVPLLGFHRLQFGNNFISIICFTIVVSFAATAYGYFISVISKSFNQAGVLGSISVMILAALGGLWVPIYIMPNMMRKISALSPLNWGMDGYYALFLREVSLGEIMAPVLKFVVFSIVFIVGSVYLQKRKNLG